MAGIDKTYTDSYKDYKEFKDWANKQIVTFFDGHQVCIGNWVYYYEESDFDGSELPIMNTPFWLDAYLVQHCKIPFVLENMYGVYDDKTIEEYLSRDFTQIPKSYKRKRKIIVENIEDRTKFPKHDKPYKDGFKWWVQNNEDLWYNENTKQWARLGFYPTNTNTAHVGSIRGIKRHLRSSYLPPNASFTISGRYVGETYRVRVL